MKKTNLLTINLSFLLILFIGMFLISGCEREEPVIEEGLIGLNIAVLIDEGFHDGETLIPIGYLVNRGATVTVIGPEVREVKAYNSELTVMIEKSVEEVVVDDFDGLIIPGGYSPANLREYETVVSFVREFVEADKLTAAICHGPQVLVTANVIEGRTLTGVSGIKEELLEAGAIYDDVPVIRDENIITSRIPNDLDDFCKTIEQTLLQFMGRV